MDRKWGGEGISNYFLKYVYLVSNLYMFKLLFLS